MIRITPSEIPEHFNHPWRKLVTVGRAYELHREDLLDHLRYLQEKLGYGYIRFHAIFHDEMQVYTEDAKGNPVYQWRHVEDILGRTMGMGFKHVIELNSMPKLMASGEQSIFNFAMNVTPPKSFQQWEDLVRAFVARLVERYGREEILTWYFECWNEPDLEGFWTGTQQQYFELYAASARAVKSVDERFRVGGPATSRGQWVEPFIKYCKDNNVPMDFVATHQYPQDEFCTYENREGSPHNPDRFFTDSVKTVRERVDASAGTRLPLLYTEWNTQNCLPGQPVSWSRNPDVDNLYAGSFICHISTELDNVVDMLGWWVASDLFEFQHDIAMPTAPFSNTYGLVTVDCIPKASFHALHFLKQLEGKKMDVALSGEQPPLAGAVATEEYASVRVLIWNHQSQTDFQNDTWSTSLTGCCKSCHFGV